MRTDQDRLGLAHRSRRKIQPTLSYLRGARLRRPLLGHQGSQLQGPVGRPSHGLELAQKEKPACGGLFTAQKLVYWFTVRALLCSAMTFLALSARSFAFGRYFSDSTI